VEVAPTYHDFYYTLPLVINGTVATVLLDSGAEFTIIEPEIAKAHSLEKVPTRTIYIRGLNGKSLEATAYAPKTLAISTLKIPSYIMATVPLSQPKAEIGGLLGFDIIGSLFGLLDTGNDRLFLWTKPQAAE
jgi:hypothetical protein